MRDQPTPHRAARPYRAPVPAYRRIEQDLHRQIRQGRWREGETLPSRQALAQELHVGMSTLQQAVINLIASGILREEGRATVVGRGADEQAAGDHPPTHTVVDPSATAMVGIVGMMPTGKSDMEAGQSWVPTLVRAVEKRLADDERGSHFFNRSLTPDGLLPLGQSVTALLDAGAAGIVVVMDDDLGSIRTAVESAEARRVPIVFITSEAIDLPVPHVFYDSRSAGHQAAQHLLRQGYQHLVFLSPFTTSWVRERLAGVRTALRQAGPAETTLRILPADGDAVPWVDDIGSPERRRAYEQQSYEIALELLQSGANRFGIIASSDYMALSVVRVAASLGQELGRDFGLVGFDDLPAAREQGVTSLRPPLEALGEEAARLLLRALHGERSSWQVRLRSHLMPRLSTHPHR